jgi:hypothetical protein
MTGRLNQEKNAIFDLNGRIVGQLVNQYLHAGSYELSYSAENLTSGVYFYKITTDAFSETKKMMLLK